jgi:hypothetical protein
VAEAYLAHCASLTPSVSRTTLVLRLEPDHIDRGALAATLDDGSRVSAETFRRFSCDTTIIPLARSRDGASSAVGARTRTISPALRRALALRDRTCRFPACPNHLFLDAHHVHHWADGGETTAGNLVLLCTTHHRLVHEGAVQVRRTPTGHLQFRDRRGRLIADAPAAGASGSGADDAVTLASWAQQQGITLDATSNVCHWDGVPVDYEWVAGAVLNGAAASEGPADRPRQLTRSRRPR